MNWTELRSEDQIKQISEESKTQPVLIFKHSTRCSISGTVLNRLERNWDDSKAPVKAYFLDLLSYRNVSQYIADYFHVIHESPQLLLIQQGQPTLVRSHLDIRFDEIVQALPKN
ncbi:MAG: bacillithiol system redox-active protein YtxJ [Bacteroidetes bacterium]|nr:bacillithiol system redox-active protein YtxJ [Bacteroidota bacterium]